MSKPMTQREELEAENKLLGETLRIVLEATVGKIKLNKEDPNYSTLKTIAERFDLKVE